MLDRVEVPFVLFFILFAVFGCIARFIMDIDQAVQIVRESLTVMLILSAPILIAGLLIGLAVSIMQAVTQVQDQTLSFVPKIVVMVIVAIFVTPWVATYIAEYAQRMFGGG